VNDDLLFMDDLGADALAADLPMPIRLSYDFVDVLADESAVNQGHATARPADRLTAAGDS
jgi:hypothetical protein